MFISNYDKEQMRVAIRTLQAQVTHLFDEIKELKATKIVNKVVKKKPAPIFRTAEAPWGYKLDGTPKKRPGKTPATNKETQA
jgi:hypothetical protein